MTKITSHDYQPKLCHKHTPATSASQLVQIVCQLGQLHLQVLSLAARQDQILHFAFHQRCTRHALPMVEHALWESLTTCLLTQGRHEAKRLRHWQVCLHLQKWGSFTLVLFENGPTPHVHC